jgi:hypothetical protein
MKTFDFEVLNSVVDSVNVSADIMYDTTSIYGFEDAIAMEAKYQLYCRLTDVKDYLGLSIEMLTSLVDRLYSINKDLFINQALSSFEEAYA